MEYTSLPILLSEDGDKALQIYKFILDEINSSKLVAGDKLPSIRRLCESLNISKKIVESAYAMLLDEGWLSSVPGRGYFVSDVGGRLKLSGNENYFITKREPMPYHMIDLPGIQKMVDTTLKELRQEVYNTPFIGYDEWITDRLKICISKFLYEFRGMVVDPEDIYITSSIQNLSELIYVNYNKKIKITMEDPCSKLYKYITDNLLVEVAYVNMTDDGIDVSSIPEDTDILCIQPGCQFPTASITSDEKMKAIVDWAREKDNRYIIETTFHTEMNYIKSKNKFIYDLAPDKVIYVCSFAFFLSDGFKFTYAILPKTINRPRSIPNVDYLNMRFYSIAMNNGSIVKYCGNIWKESKKKRDLIIQELKERNIKYKGGTAGYFIVLDVDEKRDMILERASEIGIKIIPISEYYYHKTTDNRLVMDFSLIPLDKIEQYMKYLLD